MKKEVTNKRLVATGGIVCIYGAREKRTALTYF